jgi:hypothetical protein
VSSIFDRVDPDTLLENTGSGGYSSPVNDGFVDWNEKKGEYSSTDEFLNRNPETGTYDSESYREGKEKYPTPELSDDPYAFPSVSGAAVSVEQSLSKITFVQGTSGQMSSAIAYIRYWSRKGTQQKTSVNYNPVNGSPADPQQALAGDFSTVGNLNVGGNSAIDTNVSGFFQSTGENPTAGFVPTNTAYQSQIRQTTPAPATPTNPSILNRLGSIFSANPGGVAAPAWANPFASQPAAPSPDNAVWQFLFNPEELQLSSGPDFNRAETWGVSDPANSGQPLSWRSNKNRKLTFGKVLLHGYTFGRRVDSLEKGLQQLFEARDGENGADGPPVLEFVWGQRVFGPCVIQNIQVREKAWDKGLLVNAEVSFDLEQVPEWTINDEFVDVLRPGRQSTVNDPTVASEGYRDTAGSGDNKEGKEEPKDDKGGGGGKAAPGTQESQLKQRQKVCDNAEKIYRDGFLDLMDKIDKSQLPNYSDVNFSDRTRSRINSLLNSYIILLKRVQDNVPGSSKINKIYSEKEMKDAINNYYLADPSSTQKLQAKSRSLVLLKQASTSVGNIAKNYYTSETCKKTPENIEKLKTSQVSKNERTYLCNSIKENKPCTILGGDVRTNPCSKKVFRCVVKENSTITVYREVK